MYFCFNFKTFDLFGPCLGIRYKVGIQMATHLSPYYFLKNLSFLFGLECHLFKKINVFIFNWRIIALQYRVAATAAAKSFQSCPTLCDPIDKSPPGSAVPGILQARTLEWVAISFSNAGK